MGGVGPPRANSSRKRRSVSIRSEDGTRPLASSVVAPFSSRIAKNKQEYRSADWETVRELANQVIILFLVLLLLLFKTAVELLLGIIDLLSNLNVKTAGKSWQCQLRCGTHEQELESLDNCAEQKSGIDGSHSEAPQRYGQGLEKDIKGARKGRKRKRSRQRDSSWTSETRSFVNLKSQITKEIDFDTDFDSVPAFDQHLSSSLHNGISDSPAHGRHRPTPSISATKSSTSVKPASDLPPQSTAPTEEADQVYSARDTSSFSQEQLSSDNNSLSSGISPLTLAKVDRDQRKMVLLKIPQPGSADAPHFDGKYISLFLKRYDWMCGDCGITGDDKRERIVRYMDYHIGEEVEDLDEYQKDGYSEEKLYVRLRKEWKDEDWEGQMASVAYLRALARNMKEGRTSAEKFIKTYNRISDTLVKRKELSVTDQVEIFVDALPSAIQDRIFLQNPDLDCADTDTYDYKTILASAREAEKSYERARRFGEKRNPAVMEAQEAHFSKVLANPKIMGGPPKIAFPEPPPQLQAEKQGNASQLKQTATRADLDELTQQMASLKVSLVELQQQGLSDYHPPTHYQQRGGGFHGQGGRGGIYGRGEYQVFNQQERNPPPQTQQPTGQVNLVYATSNDGYSAEVNAAQGNYRSWDSQDRRVCYGCFNRDENQQPILQPTHSHTTKCPQMIELWNKGCCHFDGQKWYIGRWGESPNPIPYQFLRDQPWAQQIRRHVIGTQWDYDLSRRSQNILDQQEQVRVGAEERAKAQVNSAIAQNLGSTRQVSAIAKRTLTPPVANYAHGIEGNSVGTTDRNNNSLLQYYEPFPEPDYPSDQEIDVNAVTSSRTTSKTGRKDVTDILRDRAKAEEKFPKAKSQRQASFQPRQLVELGLPMDVVSDEDDVEEMSPGDLGNTQLSVQGDGTATRVRSTKLSVAMPKTSKGLTALIQALKAPDPAGIVRLQMQKDLAHYAELVKIAGAIKEEAKSMLEPIEIDPRVIPQLQRGVDRMSKASNGPAKVAIEGNAAVGVHDYGTLVRNRWLVVAPRLQCILMGGRTRTYIDGMLDTGAECNILPLDIARTLGTPIQQVRDFTLSSVTGATFTFSGIAKIRVHVADGVGCDTVFFLIDGPAKILLGQPFVSLMKMNFIHNDDGSWDGVFHDPIMPGSSCTVMVVPPIKDRKKWPPQGKPAYVESDGDSEEEN